jgi:hypothetical protein
MSEGIQFHVELLLSFNLWNCTLFCCSTSFDFLLLSLSLCFLFSSYSQRKVLFMPELRGSFCTYSPFILLLYLSVLPIFYLLGHKKVLRVLLSSATFCVWRKFFILFICFHFVFTEYCLTLGKVVICLY